MDKRKRTLIKVLLRKSAYNHTIMHKFTALGLLLILSIFTRFALGNPEQIISFCPEPKHLVKKDLFWQTPNGWVSYGESFDKHVTKFIGAEWKGINVGKIICIYKGDKLIGFPIALEQKHTTLVPMPTGVQWGKDLGGRKECFAVNNNIKDCPFIFEKPVEAGDVYEELDFHRGKSLGY
jgi:hypothetical protein